MPYNYQEMRPQIFTEEGVKMMNEMRDKMREKLNSCGAFRANEVLVSGDSWLMLAIIDFLVENGEIKEVTNKHDVPAQFRIFTKVYN